MLTETVILAMTATLLAGIIRTSVGVGAGIALTASLSLLFDAKMALAIMAFLQIGFGLSAVGHYWRKWDPILATRLLASVIVGVVIGSWLVSILPADWVRRVMGAGIAAAALLEFLRSRRPAPLTTPALTHQVASGLLSGVAGSMANAGGAILALHLKRLPLSYDAFLGTLSAVVLGHDIFRLAVFWGFGLLNQTALITAIALLPFVFGGGWLGIHLRHAISETILKQAVLSIVCFI